MKHDKSIGGVEFDLRGMKPGQQFFGCRKCGLKIPFGSNGYVPCIECPTCGTGMGTYTVTESKLTAPKKG